MKKLIYFGEAALLALIKSNRKRVVDGRLIYGKTEDGGKGWMFVPYNRKSPSRKRDKLLKPLESGWIKLSPLRLKVFSTVSNKLSPSEAVAVLKRDICHGLDSLLKDSRIAKLTNYESLTHVED